MPIYEDGIGRIIENRDQINTKDKLCPLPSLNDFKNANDKGLLYEHLRINNLPTPESRIIESNSFPENLDLEFPIIAKPVKGFGGGNGIRVLKNQNDINKYYRDKSFSCNTILQKFINGYDVSCNVLCNKGVIIAHTIQKETKIGNESLAPLTGFSFIEDKTIFELVEKLMQSLNWSGVANIDIRYDEDENSFKIIEVNPRFWINVDASAIAGINFPFLSCLTTLKQELDIKEIRLLDYVNLKGYVKQVMKRPWKIIDFNYLKNNTPLILALKDPLPIIYKFIWRKKK
jgi:predicted ATP-grasp superfamily ATP-dependent carboligase